MHSVDPTRCKFADEGHFVSRDLFRQQALSERGQRVYITRCGDLSTTFTTILTDLSATAPRPLFVKLTENSNTQYDFLEFVCDAIDEGHLQPGDYFVIDNAAIHGANDTFDTLLDLLDAYGITLVKGPKYSPELMPPELVFSFLKNRLRQYRKTAEFSWELVKAVGQLTEDHIWAFYHHCWYNVSA